MACHDLCYSVTVPAKKVKDEKKDETTPIALKALDEDSSTGGFADDLGVGIFSSDAMVEPPCKYNVIVCQGRC